MYPAGSFTLERQPVKKQIASKKGLPTNLELLNNADKCFARTNSPLLAFEQHNDIVEAFFELPSEHWIVQDWRAEITRQRRVVVQTKLEMHKLRTVLQERREKDGKVMDGLKPGYKISVEIPSTAERTKKDKHGNQVGHPWWVVPRITVEQPAVP